MLVSIVAVMLLCPAWRVLASTSDHEQDSKRLYDFGLGKRAAYSYVSEYKRLPVYNFGLGKRDPNRMYSFGLGKRDRCVQIYFNGYFLANFLCSGWF